MKTIDLTEEILEAKERSTREFGASCVWSKFVLWGKYLTAGFTHSIYMDTIGELKDQGPLEWWKLKRVDLRPMRYSARPHTRGVSWHGAAVYLIRKRVTITPHTPTSKAIYAGWICRRLDGIGEEFEIPDEGLRPWKGFKCKDIPDRPILEMLAKNPEQWHNWYFEADSRFAPGTLDEFNVRRAMPEWAKGRLVLAKMGMMIRRGVVHGCTCGCRGDFAITEKGFKELETTQHAK